MASINGAQILHRSPGRLRVRVPALREDPDLASRIVERLGDLPGVHAVQTNPVTASVLVLHEPEGFDEQKWSEAAHSEGLFVLSAGPPSALAPAAPRGAAAWAAWERVNHSVNRLSGNLLDLRTLIPLAMVLWSIRQILTERPLARTPWYTLLWYAFGIFTRFNPPPKGETPPRPSDNGD